MKFYHCAVIHEGEHAVTTHLTEVGAWRAAIYDVMEFLGLEDGESRMNEEQTIELETRHKVIDKMELSDLRKMACTYFEETWDNPYGYNIDIISSSLQA